MKELELRGAVEFMRSVATHLVRQEHPLIISSRCAVCEALGEVHHARALVEADLAFFSVEETAEIL